MFLSDRETTSMAKCVKCGKWAGIFSNTHDYDCTETSAVTGQAPASFSDASASPQSREYAGHVMKRYRDAYAKARAIIAFGGVVKVLGIIVAALTALSGIINLANAGPYSSTSGVLGWTMILLGIVIAIVGWAIGLLIQAAGQMTLAQLDCAVNSSPFLTDQQRATMMML